jgi:aminotransferase in exopolysaccharide biosynthesis
LAGNEWQYVKDCLDTGWVSSAGAYVTKFEDMVAAFAGSRYGVACVNGTSGLHLSMHLLGVGPGDHILVPNITFIASANAASYTFAEPIFVDVDPATWQMDLDLLEAFLATETEQHDDGTTWLRGGGCIKAIMPVHVLGNMGDIERLVALCDRYRIHVVEDASESLGSYRNGKHSGSFGRLGVFSFNGNKIITTGGGGVIVTDDEALARRAKHLSTQAKANPDTYYHDEIGFNYRLVNILAAIGVAQMEQLPGFIERKKAIDAYYREQLAGVGDFRFQHVEPEVDPNCWLFTFSSARQADILRALQANDIIARPFWMPMNQLPMFRDKRYVQTHDHSRRVHAESLSLPSSVSLTEEELARVVAVVKGV